MNSITNFRYGAFGAIVPDILLVYSKRFTAPFLEFENWKVIFVTALYAITAGIIASIFPYPGQRTAWKSLAVGVALPAIISSLISAGDKFASYGTSNLFTRGPTAEMHGEAPKLQGSIIDLMALF